MIRKQVIALFAVLAVSQDASAAAPIIESAAGGYKITIPYGAENKRVGNAVITTIQWTNGPDDTETDRVLAACDGSWYALLDVAWVYKGENMISFSTDLPLEPVIFTQTSDSSALYAGSLKKHAAQLCKMAGAEPRNFVLPVAVGSTRSEDKSTSSALLLGTRTKSSGSIELWIRTSEFEYKPTLDSSGNPMQIAGKPQFTKVATGNYNLHRAGFDCRNRTVSTYQVVSYVGDAAPKEYSIPRDKVEPDAAIPGTVGEAELETVCKLYSDLT